jgi:hypothetical protein
VVDRRKDPKGSESDDQLRAFLVGIATDPAALGRYVRDPETSMAEADLSPADAAVLRSGDPATINARLAGGPGAAPGGAAMLVVDVAGEQVSVRPLVNFPQLVQHPQLVNLQPQLVNLQPQLVNLQPQLVNLQPQLVNVQPPMVLPVAQPILPPQQVAPLQIFPPPVHQLVLPPIHPPQQVWPLNIFPPPVHPIHPPPIIDFPVRPPLVIQQPPPQIHHLLQAPQLVFQQLFPQVHPQLVAPGPFGQ